MAMVFCLSKSTGHWTKMYQQLKNAWKAVEVIHNISKYLWDLAVAFNLQESSPERLGTSRFLSFQRALHRHGIGRSSLILSTLSISITGHEPARLTLREINWLHRCSTYSSAPWIRTLSVRQYNSTRYTGGGIEAWADVLWICSNATWVPHTFWMWRTRSQNACSCL